MQMRTYIYICSWVKLFQNQCIYIYIYIYIYTPSPFPLSRYRLSQQVSICLDISILLIPSWISFYNSFSFSHSESQPSKPGEPLQVATADEDSPSRQQADEAKSPNSEVAENTTSSSDSKIFVTTVNIVKPSVKKAPDISACSVKQVSDILRELGMAKYVVKFEAEMIDGEMLMCVMGFDDGVLMSDFGLNKLHCMKLRKYLDGWRPKV